MSSPGRNSYRKVQRGVAAIEFSLVAVLFFTLLIGIIEFGRVLYLMNAAAEATRLGARVAVVCDVNSPAIRNQMRGLLGVLRNEDITVSYEPANCTRETCEWVEVSVVRQIDTFIPIASLSFNLPSFSTRLPRESLDSVGGTNPVCR